ncbi:cyclic nucleotide-binding domain-containing protein [Ilumatobacter nonamiensis]|uniref:cyclic nucleotide-binding domain-containing protein n=1 Tax=Ilumatobacter nonamiensis TaxID=467093 RepID=UPI000349AB9F|nr:cyclic nucleotide-binding domain-containing protein [Ilumatobacter nonamiensis]
MDAEQLRSIPLFDGLDEGNLASCAEPFTEIEMVAGSSLAKQDDFAYKFFVVLDGEVDVHRNFEFVTSLGRGEFFGETALVKHEKRNARVTAKTRCRLACMMSWEFTAMTERFPIVAERIEAVVREREA